MKLADTEHVLHLFKQIMCDVMCKTGLIKQEAPRGTLQSHG